MTGHKRNIFPGGNTPHGFHSYYNYIIEQNKAEKIFCIKGGPGTGKSTLMKEIGELFISRGEDVDFLWCSSDPESLDGILIRERRIALVDGTSPHITDPVNPGAVDKIIDMGECWDEETLRLDRDRITSINVRTGRFFKLAYGYLHCAGTYRDFISHIMDEMITEGQKRDAFMQLSMAIDSVPAVKRAEAHVKNDHAMGRDGRVGIEKKFFADAITPAGIRSGLESLVENTGRLVIIKTAAGFNTGKMIAAVSDRLRYAGFDTELYYCPMSPDKRPEHIVCAEADLAVVTENEYHSLPAERHSSRKTRVIEIDPYENGKNFSCDILPDLKVKLHENIDKAIKMLAQAKKCHDELESCYISAMDFHKCGLMKESIINEIENILK